MDVIAPRGLTTIAEEWDFYARHVYGADYRKMPKRQYRQLSQTFYVGYYTCLSKLFAAGGDDVPESQAEAWFEARKREAEEFCRKVIDEELEEQK